MSFLGRYQPYWFFLRFILSYMTECIHVHLVCSCGSWKRVSDPVDLKLRR